MAEKLGTNLDYADKEIYVGELSSVGAYSVSYSFREAAEQAQTRGSRLESNAEYQREILHNERERERALQRGDMRDFEIYSRQLALLHGNNFGSPGYAGARTGTGTIVDTNTGITTDVDYVYSKTFDGRTSFYSDFYRSIVQTRQMQERGQTAYIQKIIDDPDSPDFGLPLEVGPEPNPEYHGAVFWISPQVTDVGVITRGIHHAVGEPCAKYDIMIQPPDYKDIMLGHRTVGETGSSTNRNRNRLISTVGAVGLFVNEIFQGGRLERSAKELEKIAEHYLPMNDFKNVSRRAFLAGLTGLVTAAAAENAYTQFGKPMNDICKSYGNGLAYAGGAVFKRIANDEQFDNAPITRGKVTLRNGSRSYQAYIERYGDFRMREFIPEGLYEVVIEDLNGAEGFSADPSFSSVAPGNYFVPHRTTISIIGCSPHFSVIERGPNRFGVPFDQLFQEFYSKIAQRMHQSVPGMIRWGEGAFPQFFVTVDSSVPPEYNDAAHYGKFLNFLRQAISEDTIKFYGGRLTTIPLISGTPSDFTIEVSFDRSIPPDISDYPVTNNRRIIRSRNKYNPDFVLAQMPFILELPYVMRHAPGHAAGYSDFNDANFDSIMNGELFAGELTVNDELVGYLAYHPSVRPGNTSPDNNP